MPQKILYYLLINTNDIANNNNDKTITNNPLNVKSDMSEEFSTMS